MSLVSNNIKSLRRKHQYTQEQFAQKLGIKRSLLGAYEEARAKPRLEILVKAASLFNVSVDRLVAEDLRHEAPSVRQPGLALNHTSRERAPIKLVGKQEQTDYFLKRDHQQYLAGLSEITFPMIHTQPGTYRAFEITEEAMLPVVPGTIVIGRKEENLQVIRDGQVYMVITREGMMLRTVYNRIAEDGTLLLRAANPSFKEISLSLLGKEVEVWEVLYYISQQMPFGPAKQPTSGAVDLQQLTAMVLDLQQEVLKLKKGLKD